MFHGLRNLKNENDRFVSFLFEYCFPFVSVMNLIMRTLGWYLLTSNYISKTSMEQRSVFMKEEEG